MTQPSISYERRRFPPEMITHAVWLYARFNLRLREVEEMLLERGLDASYMTIRRRTRTFGLLITRNLRRRQARPDDMVSSRNGSSRTSVGPAARCKTIGHLEDCSALCRSIQHTRNCFSVPFYRRADLTTRYHRLEAFDAWKAAGSVA